MAYPQTSFARTVIPASSLIGQRRQAVASSTLLYQLEVLKQTGRYDAFKLQWHPTYDEPPEVWPIPNHLFWDSDIAKWIEGACYFMQQQSLPEIDLAVMELVDMIRHAQQPDGYLNIHYTVVEPGKRFTNLRDMHELYNAGHMIEAALAHNAYYRNDLLLQPVIAYIDLIYQTFGSKDGQIAGYPGHPEIELALLRLYDRTGDAKHLELAQFFLTERGNPQGVDGRHFFDVEAEKRGDDPAKQPAFYPKPRSMWYHQAHAPIAAQETVEGHSVRAMYLLTAVADLVRLNADTGTHPLKGALSRLWDNMVQKKMYVTGGIGAIKQWEGFGLDFFLPQGTDEGGCYSETCAAIGVMMLAERLLQIDLDGQYGDIMELCLYNAVLTAMSHDGKRFTYVNQLASSDSDPSKREEWFTVACCPPNVLRLLGQIGGYIWNSVVDDSTNAADVRVHLYVTSELGVSVGSERVTIKQESNWPWDDTIKFTIDSDVKTSMKLRIPSWSTQYKLVPNCETANVTDGYLTLPADWIAQNPAFTLCIPLRSQWVAQNPLTRQNTISLARGPLIYCVEDYDNTWVSDHFASVMVDADAAISTVKMTDKDSGDHYVRLTVADGAYRTEQSAVTPAPFVDADTLDVSLRGAQAVPELHFVPYFFRANRGGQGQMRVGLRPWKQPA